MPAAQFKHVADDEAASEVEYVPAMHCVHPVARVDDHVPIPQLVHVEDPSLDHEPGLQLTHE